MATPPTIARPWDYYSAVKCCDECNGHGYHEERYSDRRSKCEWCDGPHEPECEVCGFDQVIRGYDCIVCEFVSSMDPADQAALNVDKVAEAMRHAKEAAIADHAQQVAA